MELSEGCGETLRVRVAGVVRGLFMLLRACRRAKRREVCQGGAPRAREGSSAPDRPGWAPVPPRILTRPNASSRVAQGNYSCPCPAPSTTPIDPQLFFALHRQYV